MLYFFYTDSEYTLIFFFFFFQAEDGIRDKLVTGVQTCALPISQTEGKLLAARLQHLVKLVVVGGEGDLGALADLQVLPRAAGAGQPGVKVPEVGRCALRHEAGEIGRASCRERGWISVVAVGLKK